MLISNKKINKLSKKIDQLVRKLDAKNTTEYIELAMDTKRLIWKNFVI